MYLDWSLKNQNLAAGGMMVTGTIVCTAIVVHDNRKGNRDAKNDAEQKHQESLRYSNKKHDESRRYFEGKFTEVKDTNLQTQRLLLSCAVSTMKGFQGDTSEIDKFVKIVEKAMGCMEGGC